MLQRVFLFTVFSFLRICSSVKHASLCTHRHITVFMFLHVHTTINQDVFSSKSCWMSHIKPSYAFKLNLCLTVRDKDKVVYFTLEQTPKNWAVHYALLGKELPQQNMLIKIRILMLKSISDIRGEKMSFDKSLRIHAKSWKIILSPDL